ncbi:hypothetical protein NQ318_020053 [Aromia moschata]|uniref:Uncharacterized protein n=1 Tax=Aromia moschata TaxID=1265417 RepID=A0AAV8ZB56_9CUCU|nr:hypothetical protein NQ318_020053 [Aromia moschata]
MVPKLVTPEQKESRMKICADILNNIDTDPGFLHTVTLNGTICRNPVSAPLISLPDLSWTRFGSLPLRSKARLNRENGVATPKHKDIAVWLRELDLEEYHGVFRKFQGGGGPPGVLRDRHQGAGGEEVVAQGSDHQQPHVSSREVPRVFTYRSENFSRKPPIRHSVAVDSGNKIQREDTL